MNALNIKLYNLIRSNLHIPDEKAEEFVQVLDDLNRAHIKDAAVEFKSLVKEDFSKIYGELSKLDSKIDLKVSDLRSEIKESKVDTIKWMVGIFLALALMIIGLYIKK